MKENFVINPHFAHLEVKLKRLLQNFEKDGEVLDDSGRNIIKTKRFEALNLNIKKFKTPSFLQSLVYRFLRKSKARRSFEYALRLRAVGILTPEPIAYKECFSVGLKDSFYVSEQIDYDFDFRVINHQPNFPDREKILRQFTEFTYKLHENNIHFLDHSPGNTLIKKKADGNYEFYLIDLNRMRFEKMKFNMRMKNFRRLWLSKTMLRIIAEENARLYGKPVEEVQKVMRYYSRRFQKIKNAKALRRRRKNSK
ncbi:MAG: lipopolysaccharide kinase [Bacteroidetes bacterium]|nr:lipopolysaccharide kinase [Bacteroidota bacterium]